MITIRYPSILDIGVCLGVLFLVSCGGQNKKKEEKPVFNTKETTTFKKTEEMVSTIPKSENVLGRRVFLLCAACHNVVKGEPHKVGPNLNGFLGNKAASKTDYIYSEALKDKDIIWSEATLRAWLDNPAGYVPGTKMAFVGVAKKEQQDALIAYLEEVTQ